MSTTFLQTLSKLFGWTYMLLWSASFYPQMILNYRRKSTQGATIDFPVVNVIGFFAYFISNLAFLYSPLIRGQYAARHHDLVPTVQVNDLAFAAHALVVTTITLTQFWPWVWGFDKDGKTGPGANISNPIKGLIVGCVVGVLGLAFFVAGRPEEDPATSWAWIDVVYAISYVKLVITIVKYAPQVRVNIKNQSTEGWSIGQIIFDFTGGILSIAQLGIDSYLQRSWSGVTGNPVKLALGNVSIIYDIIFMLQHFVFFRQARLKAAASTVVDEQDPLLSNGRS